MKSLKLLNGKSKYLLASLPFIGYTIAHYFEQGYLNFYSIPSHFIRVSLDSVIVATCFLLFALVSYISYLVIGIFRPFSLMHKLQNTSWLFTIIYVLVLEICATVVFGLAYFTDNLISWFGITAMILLFTIFSFYIAPWILFRNKAANTNDSAVMSVETITLRIRSYFFSGPMILFSTLLLIAFSVCIVITIPLGIGYWKASTEHSFIMFSYENKKYILIRTYGDSKIAVGFDEKRETVTKNILLLGQVPVLKGQRIKVIKLKKM